MDFSKWSHLLYRYMWLFLPVIIFAETAVFICWSLMRSFPYGVTARTYVVCYIIRPTVVNITILTVAYGPLTLFVKKGWQAAQAYLVITISLAICMNILYVHAAVYTIYAIIGLPVVVALLFIDIKPLIYAMVSSLSALFFFCLRIAPSFPGVRVLSLPEMVGLFAGLCSLFTVCLIILALFHNLVQQVVLKSQQASEDSLTKVLNHASFQKYITECTELYQTNHTAFTLVICDLDNFKAINDTFGHIVGDRVLLCFSDTLRTCLRNEDSVFRYGGEEFTLLIAGNSAMAEQIVKNIRHAFQVRLHKLTSMRVTFCAGICEYNPAYFLTIERFFNAADQVLYEAKHTAGKNTVTTWRAEALLV